MKFSKKANRSKADLIHDTDLRPGSCLMLYLQQNTSCYGLNRSTHFPYFLQITDAYTHFTVLLGLSEVSAAAILNAFYTMPSGSNPIRPLKLVM